MPKLPSCGLCNNASKRLCQQCELRGCHKFLKKNENSLQCDIIYYSDYEPPRVVSGVDELSLFRSRF
jgi:hypothetical protein